MIIHKVELYKVLWLPIMLDAVYTMMEFLSLPVDAKLDKVLKFRAGWNYLRMCHRVSEFILRGCK